MGEILKEYEKQNELLAAFLDWLIENPERFKPNKPTIMLADEFLKSIQ